MRLPVLAGALAFFALGVQATEFRFFEPGSIERIRAERQGRPFILGLWSLSCPHCPRELKELGKLKKAHPDVDIVLVSTDTPDDAESMGAMVRRHGLSGAEQWVFADPQPQRLRFEIDRRWWGELPRTYFFSADHGVEAVSGVVPAQRLKRWAEENRR